jgi:hypothetical protein
MSAPDSSSGNSAKAFAQLLEGLLGGIQTRDDSSRKMASITEVGTSEAPGPLPIFSQSIKANGFVFCSGSTGFDEDTMQLVDGGIKAQTVLIPTKSPEQTNNLMAFTGTNTQKPCGCSESC